jgi:hypothetical protein
MSEVVKLFLHHFRAEGWYRAMMRRKFVNLNFLSGVTSPITRKADSLRVNYSSDPAMVHNFIISYAKI